MSELRIGPQIVAYEAEREARGLLKRAAVRIAPSEPEPASDCAAAYAEIWHAMEEHFGGEHVDAGKIVCASLTCGPHPKAIASLTAIPLYRIRRYGRVLLDNGIWTTGGQVSISFSEPDNENLWIIEIIMQALAADGIVVRDKPERKEGICENCAELRSCGAGRFCRPCYVARSALLYS